MSANSINAANAVSSTPASVTPSTTNRNALYTLAGLTGASAMIPLAMVGKTAKDVYQSNGKKLASALGSAAQKNPWTLLTSLGLAATAGTLVSKDSLSSQMSLTQRAGAFGKSLGTNVISTFTELGAAGLGVTLACAGKTTYRNNGNKLGSAIGTVLKRNPIGTAAFTGLAGISLWLEKKSWGLQDKAIAGK